MNTNTNKVPVEIIDYLESYYDTFKSLPTKAVTCNETGMSVTMFGSNLTKRINQYGSIRELLTSFVGRGARKQIKTTGKSGRTEAKVSIKTT